MRLYAGTQCQEHGSVKRIERLRFKSKRRNGRTNASTTSANYDAWRTQSGETQDEYRGRIETGTVTNGANDKN